MVWAVSNVRVLKVSSWLLGALVTALAVVVWMFERIDGKSLTAYDYFPLFGITAFSLMWTHYATGSLRRLLCISKQTNKLYSTVSSITVLALILLHPGILVAQLYKDGFGLPPMSYLTVYAESKLVIGLGTISLIIFLLFELKRRFNQKKWWRYVEGAQVLAMVMIFFHGLTLGRELTVPWFQAVWYVYGVSFICFVGYNYWQDKRMGVESDAEK